MSTHVFVAVGTFLLAIITAYAAFRLYDLPVREWLKSKLFKVNNSRKKEGIR